MNVRSTVEELTQVCMEIRRSLDSTADRKEQEKLILKHIKAFSSGDQRISDFQTVKRKELNEVGSDSVGKTENEDAPLTEEEIREFQEMNALKETLDKELCDLRLEESEFQTMNQTMNLLHRYNDIKDATRMVIGAIAVARQDTIGNLYERYDLSTEEKKNFVYTPGLEWFNISEGLSVTRHLIGKITILDFFTYCCINCMHILPDLDALEKKYSVKDGLVVVGVHSAKFSNERDSKRLLSAVQRYNIKHPVVNDGTMSTWRNLGVSCWPTLVMIGPKAQPLAVFVGEGHREELFLYVDVALRYFKSLNLISSTELPSQPEKHLLPVARQKALSFPGKLDAFQTKQGERLVVSDTRNNRVLVMHTNGTVEHVIAGNDSGFIDGDFETARFNAPQGVCAFEDAIYVADNENHAVRKIDLKKKIVTTVAGTGSQGHDYVGGKMGKDQALSSPWDVDIYHYEQGEITVPILLIAIAGTHQIWALFLEDTVWWKNRKYKAGTCAAIVGSGREENRNNSYPHAAGLAQPSGLVVVQERKSVFFADSESSSIRRVDLVTGRVSSVCGGNKNPADLHDYGDTDGVQYAAKLQHPLGLTWHPIKKVLYVTDTYNHKIKKVEIAKGDCKAVYGNGKPKDGFFFDEPSDIVVGSNGNILYVVDTNNHSVKRIDLESENIASLSVKIPRVDMVSDPKNKHIFDATIDEKGGEFSVKFNLTFLKSDVKLNVDSPQRWAIDLPTNTWTTKVRTGDLSSPICIKIPEGNGTSELQVILDIVTCTSTECVPKRLCVIYRVHQKSNAPSNVNEVKELVVK